VASARRRLLPHLRDQRGSWFSPGWRAAPGRPEGPGRPVQAGGRSGRTPSQRTHATQEASFL